LVEAGWLPALLRTARPGAGVAAGPEAEDEADASPVGDGALVGALASLDEDAPPTDAAALAAGDLELSPGDEAEIDALLTAAE